LFCDGSLAAGVGKFALRGTFSWTKLHPKVATKFYQAVIDKMIRFDGTT
jgi:hypothetical protein